MTIDDPHFWRIMHDACNSIQFGALSVFGMPSWMEMCAPFLNYKQKNDCQKTDKCRKFMRFVVEIYSEIYVYGSFRS